MNKIVAPILLGSLVATALAGCVLVTGQTTQAQHSMMGGDSDTDTDGAKAFDMNDVMFAQMMIPHHEQAVELATLAETHTTNPKILDLAARIKAAQAPEISQMRGWLKTAGMGMSGSDNMAMPGLVSDADMATIKAASGAKFDKLFLVHMIAHHEGAITMANDVLKTSTNDEVISLAKTIVTSQQAEIDEMKALLG
jgi:uncharacterized protein (DUF305 family)